MSHNAEKTDRGSKGFFNIHSVAKHQKIEGGHFEEFFFRKKVSQCRKNWKEDPLVSPGIVCYAETEEKPLVQFAKPNHSIWDHKIS